MKISDDTFSQRTRLRQFELVVEKKSLFVNAHYLAELSPYFRMLCFGDSFRSVTFIYRRKILTFGSYSKSQSRLIFCTLKLRLLRSDEVI
ncbi:unnamed protein product [Gongylonema pulchrum]|uniref:HTH LytTR-type domain-containing protein n=1 Tax=Gongylonema pulchrum TaxID=637853 RepID=A0A183DX53_9BILA|nr:unnamed protein product [Gongylonema pulchrum]